MQIFIFDMFIIFAITGIICILGMVTAMDDAVGMVVEEMKTQGLFDNSIIVFSADVSSYNRAKI